MIRRFSKEEFKGIVTAAIEEAKQKENIDVNFHQLGFIELYKYFKEQEYSLVKESSNSDKKLSIPASPLLTIACYNMTSGFVIQSTKSAHLILRPKFFYPSLGSDHQLAKALITSYHEFYHIYQSYTDRQDDYHKAIYQIETMISENKYSKYYRNHRHFLKEIEAEKYGIAETEQFLQANAERCKNSYNHDRTYIEYSKKKNEYNQKNYDLNFLLGILHKIVTDDPKVINETFLTSIYNEDGTFKKISTILQDPEFKNLDQRIQQEIIASDYFLKSVDFDNISSTELTFIQQSLKYRYDLAAERRNYNRDSLKEQMISPATWLKRDCDLASMLSSLTLLTERLVRPRYSKDTEASIDNVKKISKNIKQVESAAMHH